MIKRFNYIIFWSIYFGVLFYQEYQWDKTILLGYSESEIAIRVLIATIAFVIPQIICSSIINKIALNNLIFSDQINIRSVLNICIVILITVFVIRIQSYYFIRPVILKTSTGLIEHLWGFRSLFSILLYISLPIGINLLIQNVHQQIEFYKREKDLTKEKLTAELSFLRSQMNPHFLFNTLNNIYVLSRKKSDLAPEAILKLSDLLSFMLYETDKGEITIFQEMKFIEDYIALQKIRYTTRLKLNIEKDIDDYSQNIAPLLFIPLFENAFKHGAGETSDEVYISVNIKLLKGVLDFQITNSFDKRNNKKVQTGIGLTNLQRQLELTYKNQNMFVIQNENTFVVKIKIDLNNHENI